MSKTMKRSIGVVPVAIVAAVGLGSGVAFAAVMSQVKAEGTVGRGQFVATFDPGVGKTAASIIPLNADGSDGTPTTALAAPTVSADGKTLTAPSGAEVFVGETMHVGAMVKITATQTGYVSGITASTAVPAGWKISLKGGCGTQVDPANGSSVALRLTPTADTGPALDLKALGLSITVTKGTKPASVVCTDLGN